jgi:DNA-binding SARP family transcriptional activator/tetratricopeptide (TPR) repeat protein
VDFVILGPTQLIDGDVAIPLGAAKQRGMLALLLLQAGNPVRVDTLIEHLWDEPGRADRRSILYSMASRLRAVLHRAGMRDALVRVPAANAYRLDIDPLTVDFHQFRDLVSRARDTISNSRHDISADLLQRAIQLWRGDPLSELHGARADQQRRQLDEALLDAHKLLATSQLRLGQVHDVLVRLETLIQEHELDETLARAWISALCGAGREDDARRYLAEFRRRFRKELRLEPRIDIDAIVREFAAGRTPVILAPGPRPHQLPAGIRGFAGRTEMLTVLDAMTGPEPANVVVVTGMPGVGKTALAVHWSRRHRDRYPDGQLYLDAGAYGPGAPVDPHEALSRFLHALGLESDRIPQEPEARRQCFNDTLDGRRVLLVLDNVADSEQARPMIPQSGACRTVITSRTRLSGLTIREGVHTLTVTPLSETESIGLLIGIVGEARAADEPEAVESLAAAAGGLPLALRIVGEHVAERPRASLTELARELRHHLLESTDGGDDRTDLTTVFTWSYRSLPAEAAAMFRKLALHPGARISLEAAAALDESAVRAAEALLNVLAKAHLIEHDTARHYRFHDLLRQYAALRAAMQDEPSDIARRRQLVLDWFLLSAVNAAARLMPDLPPVPDLPDRRPPQVLTFATDAEAMRWCEAERQNFSAATRSARRHAFHRHAWQIPGAVYEIFDRTGRHDDILRMNRIAVSAARLDSHLIGEIGSLINLGAAHFAQHEYDLAVAAFTEARECASAAGHIEAETICAHGLASAHLRMGDASSAITIHRQVLAVCRQIADRAGEAATLNRLGDAYRHEGRREHAADAYLQALQIRTETGSVRGQGLIHHDLGRLYLEGGDLISAARHCRTALHIHERTEDAAARCDALTTMAEIWLASARTDKSLRDARAAVRIGAEIDDCHRRARALAVLAEAQSAAGSAVDAAGTRAAALQIMDGLRDPDIQRLRARLSAAAGSPGDAPDRQ